MMDTLLEKMSRNFFGYGRWDAPYWFIGLEQGGSDNEKRAEVFKKLESNGLCDCKQFHHSIEEFRWHRDNPALQPTWSKLMLLLSAYTGSSHLKDNRREYQRDSWGSETGMTCVIDLCCVSSVKLSGQMQGKPFIAERTDEIIEKISDKRPELVVMYGLAANNYWDKIAKCELKPGKAEKIGSTNFVLVPSPTSFGQKNEVWTGYGGNAAKLNERTGSWIAA